LAKLYAVQGAAYLMGTERHVSLAVEIDPYATTIGPRRLVLALVTGTTAPLPEQRAIA